MSTAGGSGANTIAANVGHNAAIMNTVNSYLHHTSPQHVNVNVHGGPMGISVVPPQATAAMLGMHTQWPRGQHIHSPGGSGHANNNSVGGMSPSHAYSHHNSNSHAHHGHHSPYGSNSSSSGMPGDISSYAPVQTDKRRYACKRMCRSRVAHW
jgi:hypothetical protein